MPVNNLKNVVYNLKIPLTLSKNEKFKSFSIFEGITAGLLEISCNALTLSKGYAPHDFHNHEEEEILFILSGSVNLLLRDSNNLVKNGNMNLREGQIIYFPANFSHKLIATNDIPANYLTLKWKSNLKNKNTGLNFAYFDLQDNKDNSLQDNKDNKKDGKFLIKKLFESPTLYLKKLHCHMLVMDPGGSIEAHRDIYDVVSIVLEGEAETLGKKVTPYDVTFYATGEPHGINNRGDNTVREVAFEFHTNKLSLMVRNPYLLNNYFHKLIKLKFWKKKIKKIFRF